MWGKKKWESDNFLLGWDGKLNGSFVAEGTYFWILEAFYDHTNIKQILKREFNNPESKLINCSLFI
ncbi:MAG: hypothetical protein DRI95_09080 [Bacteroidetes bacterium]|nr:MAG: hypothetical protein DRI95_09080 [Bacteroidota bacterium]